MRFLAVTALLLVACHDPTLDSPECDYDAGGTKNPEGCPEGFDIGLTGTSCPMKGLSCEYPGRGDGTPSGCNATAVLACGLPTTDGGPPAWRGAQ